MANDIATIRGIIDNELRPRIERTETAITALKTSMQAAENAIAAANVLIAQINATPLPAPSLDLTELQDAIVASLNGIRDAVKAIPAPVVGGGSGDTGGNTGGNTGGGTPTTAVYKLLTMADATTPVVDGIYPTLHASEINLGTGAESLTMNVGQGLGSLTYLNLAQAPIEFDIYITDENGRHHVGSRIHASGWGWQGATAGYQRVTLNGDWGTVKQFEIVSSGAGYGEYVSFRDVALNGLPFYNGGSTFAAGGSGSANKGYTFTDAPPVVVVVPGAPPPPSNTVAPSVVAGVLINGVVAPAATLAEIMKTVPAGALVELPSGHIHGTTSVPVACTIRGKGMLPGGTEVDSAGMTPTFQKGVFVPLVPGVVFEDMVVEGAAVSDANGAGIRDELYNGVGAGFTANRVRFTGDQDGVLTFGGRYIFNECEFDHDGAGDGQSHNLYIGGQHIPTSYAEFNDCISHDAMGGHVFKCRAATCRVNGGVYTSGGDAATINAPVGGDYVFGPSPKTGLPTRILVDTDKPNHNAIQYGVDYYNDADDTNAVAGGNAAVGKTLDLGPSIIETTGNTAAGVYGPAWATLNVSKAQYKGTKPDLSPWRGPVVGTLSLAA